MNAGSASGAAAGMQPGRLRGWVMAIGSLLVAALIYSAPAHAFSQRGHVPVAGPNGSFGEGGKGKAGEEPTSRPSGIAVNEASSGEGAGDVYVLESANNRVVRFGPAPEHKFIEAWGYGVETGAEAFQRCSKVKECRAGNAAFGNKGQFSSPQAIAVDNASGSPSVGDVYVVANNSRKKGLIDKFNFKGELVGTLKTQEAEGAIDGVAVDSSGTVWVDREDGEETFLLERYNDATPNKELGEAAEIEVPEVQSGARPTRPGFAVDPAGDVYITYEPHGKTAEEVEEEEEKIAENEKERKKNGEPPANEKAQQPCEKNPCLVAKLETFPAGSTVEAEPLIAEVDLEATSGVAVDASSGTQSSGDVYLNNLASVAAFSPAGSLVQRFGEAQLSDHSGSGLAVDAKTGEVLVGDSAAGTNEVSGKVDVYELEGPGAPTAAPGSVAASEVTASSAKLRALLDPSGLDTGYRFRYGTVPCAGEPSPCAETSEQALGAVYEDVPASVELTGLTPGATYHFLAVAKNGSGSAESEERTFKTPKAGATEAALPDGRGWELVSPADKRGVAIEPIAHEGGLIQAASDGRGLAYLASAPAGEEEPHGNRAPELTQLVAARTAPGKWTTQNITTSNEAARGVFADERREYQFFSADLAFGVVFPYESLPPSETEEPTTEHTIYLRESACAKPPKCYSLLATSVATGMQFQGATPDLAHAIVRSGSRLELHEWSKAGTEAGHLTLVNVLPTGEPPTTVAGVGLGTLGKYEGARHAMSEDGSRVVWADEVPGQPRLFHLYDSQLKPGGASFESSKIDTPEPGVVPVKTPKPFFQTASANGSRVFFTDDQRLTHDASPESEEQGDLYVFEPEKPEGERLTDLTPDLNHESGEGAAIQGGVIGASDDGSYVYFVANGVLASGAQPGNCVYEGSRASSCNLYVVHNNGEKWEEPHLIARLSNEDGPDWGANANSRVEYALFRMTARVSRNGRYLAFMSDRRVTGYNNTDARSGAPDEEVYLYHAPEAPAAEPGSLVCASCNPSGAQPVGVHDIQESSEGRGLLVDRPEIWTPESEEYFDHWLAGSVPGWTPLNSNEALYQSHYLTNEGRLFFNSPDALVRQASNGKNDVYEYEPSGVGGCGTLQSEANAEGGCVALISSGSSQQESAFLDASENGNDVFFLTSTKLSPQDPDGAFDIYDARVCEGLGAQEPCPSTASGASPPCESEGECKGTVLPPAGYGAPASSVLSGSGNIAPHSGVEAEKHEVKPGPTKKQLLEKALKACKKDKKKSKRLACEKQARKKYAAKASKAKKASVPSKPTAGASPGARR